MIITDWSDISFEYAYTTCKPVLFIDTPMKVMNPEYKKIDTEPINIWMRNVIGETLKLDEIGKVNETVERMLDSAEMYHEKIDNFAHEYLYNMGHSAEVGAKYIISSIQEKIKNNKNKQ